MTFASRTWTVGEVVSAALMNQEIRDQFASMFAAWTGYVPAWTTSGTAPAVGNGNILGRHMKIGRTEILHINFVFGSTTTYGTGNFSFSLPNQAANAGASLIGCAHFLGTDRWGGQTVISPNASNLSPFFPVSATNTRVDFMTTSRPETLASGGQLRMTTAYETAA